MKGKIKFFDETRGFGFVTGEDQKDYFVHSSKLIDNVAKDVEVTFEIKQTEKGAIALNVKRLTS
jgi:cold shock protein